MTFHKSFGSVSKPFFHYPAFSERNSITIVTLISRSRLYRYLSTRKDFYFYFFNILPPLTLATGTGKLLLYVSQKLKNSLNKSERLRDEADYT